jgi:hypothetical protein
VPIGQIPWNKKPLIIIDGVEHKACGRCKKLVPLILFTKNKHRPHGVGGYCIDCHHKLFAECAARYRPKKLANGRRDRAALRLEVLSHYGVNGVPECQCCGERILEFLGIDHIEGGGSKHKKEIKITLYRWLKKHNFPEGFRDLCHNCNQALGAYGYCPHQKNRRAELVSENGC